MARSSAVQCACGLLHTNCVQTGARNAADLVVEVFHLTRKAHAQSVVLS